MRPVSGKKGTVPFSELTPDVIVDAIEAAGYPCDGRVLALGSYENRVYQVGVEEAEPVVVKFYRPGRWTDEAIQEEHDFALELAAAEIPVIAPVKKGTVPFSGEKGDSPLFQSTLLHHAGLPLRHLPAPRRAVAGARHGGGPAVDGPLPRAHSHGRQRADASSTGRGCRPRRWAGAASSTCSRRSHPGLHRAPLRARDGQLLEEVESAFEAAGELRFIRIHGDCHRNNVLWTPRDPHFVDLDDCMMGPRPGPVDAGGRQRRPRCAPSSTTCWRATRSSRTSTTASGADRAAAGAAHGALRGLARASLGRPGLSAWPSRGSARCATGSGTRPSSRNS
jgi:hypothetical protein